MADPLDELLGDLKPSAQAINLDALLGDLKPPKPLPPVVAKSITPRAPAPAPTTPIMQSTIDPFASAQDWIPSQPKQRPQPKPSTLAAPGDSLAAAPAAPLAPTIETSPAGKTNAPIPGKIPGMERIGDVAPGVKRPQGPQQLQGPDRLPPPQMMGDGMSDLYARQDDVISDAVMGPAFVRNASSATLGFTGGVLSSLGERSTGAKAPVSGPNWGALPGAQDRNPMDEKLTGAGKALTEADTAIQETFARDASIKNFMDDPAGAMSDPRWWLDSTFSAAGSMAPMIATGTGTASVVGRVAGSGMLAPELAAAAAKYGPAVASSLTESAQVFGSTYNEARKAGLDPDTAREAASLVAAGTGLTAIPAHKVGIFNDQIRSISRKIATSAAAESGQEGVQTWWENAVAKTFYDPNRPLMQGVPEAMVGSAIIGGTTGSSGINEQARNPEAAARAERTRRRGTVSMVPQGPSVERLIRDDLEQFPVGDRVEPRQDAVGVPDPMKPASESAQVFAAQPNVVERNFKEQMKLRQQEAAAAKAEAELAAERERLAKEEAARVEAERQERLKEERRQLRAKKEITVPETGVDERVSRVADARDRLSRKYFDKPFDQLTNPDRIAVDELVAEGYGFAVDQQEGPQSPGPVEEAKPAAAPDQDVDQWVEQEMAKERDAARLREEAKQTVEWSELDAATKPLPKVRLDESGRVIEDRPKTWREAQEERRRAGVAQDEQVEPEAIDEPASPGAVEDQQPAPQPRSILDDVIDETNDRQRNPVDVVIRETETGRFSVNSFNKSDGRRVGHTFTYKTKAEAETKKQQIEAALNPQPPAPDSRIQNAAPAPAAPEPRKEVIQNTPESPAPVEAVDAPEEPNAPLPPQAPASPGPVEAAAPAGVTPVKDQGKAASGKRSGPRVQASKTGLSQWTEFEVPFRQGVYDSEWKLDDDVRFTIQPEGPDGKLVVTLYESDGYEVRKEQLGVTGDRFEAYAMAEDAATEYYTPDELREIAQERDSEDSAPTAPAAPESTFGSTPAPEPKANQKVSQSAEPERRVPPQAAIGRRSPAKTARGYKVDTNFAVVPLSSLRISNTDAGEVNPDYPAELQPRQRDRKSSDEQIQTIISQFDPDQLAENYLATDGAPIIGEDMAVESGNGRSMAVRRIYSQHQDKASAYRQWIIENADRFGLDQQKVSQIDQPVLVRIRTNLPEGISRTDFGRDANERTTAGMSPGEQATIDAKAMSDDLVSLFSPNDSGDIDTVANTPFVTAFMENVVPQSERGSMRSGDGRLSTSGIRRIQNAIFAKAYNDRGMIERMTEDPDDNIKSIVGAMVAAAPRFISLRAAISRGDLHNLDISKDLTDAASTLSRLRAEGKVIDDYLAQEDMFGRPEMQDAILATMRDLGRNKAKFGDILNRYMDAVEAAGNPNQIGMFGPAEVPTPLDIWKSIIEREQVNGRTEDNAAAGRLDEGSSRVSKTRRRQEASDPSRAEASGPASPGEPGRTEGTRTSLGNTVEKTKDGLQETLVTDLEARESQLAAKRDRNTPLAEVPFSLVQEDGPPAPEGPDERQVSMFGEDSDETPAYAPRTTAAKRPGSPTPKPQQPSQPAGPGSGRMVSRSEIVKELSDMLGGLPIRTGNIAQRGAQGIFKVRQNVIRSRKALDLDTISHEIGHGLHKYLWGTDKSGKKLQVKPLDRFKGELGALDYDQNQKRPFEGFAEYIRLRLTDPTAAKAAAPQFHAWFEQVMSQPQHADMKAVLDDARDRVQSWIQQPGAAKVAASINVTPEKKNLSEKVSDAIEDYKKNFVDKFEALEKAVDLMSGLGGAVRPEENAFVLARLLSRAVNRYNSATGTRGTVGADHKINGEGLSTILRDAAKRDKSTYNPEFTKLAERDGVILANDGLDDLRVYLVAKRAEKYHKDGFETGFEDAWIQDAINATKTSEVEALAERLYKYQDRILQYMIGKGALSKDVADRFRKGDEFYVPMYRVMDKRKDSTNIGRKMIDLNSPIMKRKGSSREIIDPLESIYRNTYEFMSFADRNEVSQALVKQAEKVQDQGWLIESGIVRPMKRTEFNLSEISKEIKEALKAQGIDATGIDLDEAVAIYRPNMDPKRGDNIVRVIVDGKPKLFQFDPSLIDAMDFFNAQQANLAVKLGMWVKNISTGAFTSFNPTWAISNISIDQLTAATQSRNGYKPFVDAVWGLFKMMTDKKLIEEWELNGGGMTTMEMLSRQQIRKSIREMAHTRHGLILKNPMSLQTLMIAADIVGDLITLPGQLSEKSTRVGEYWLARRSGKSPLESSFDSNNVSLDFARSGRIAQKVNRFIPFFSVFFNATDRTMEMMRNMGPKGDPAMRRRAWTTAGLTAIASLALWLVNKDDEKYKKQERWLRDMYWLIPARWFGLDDDVFGPFVRIQKQPHWGLIFGSSVERAADSIIKQDPNAFEEFEQALWRQAMPPMQAQFMLPPLEAAANYSFFTNRQIESDTMQKRSPVNRYTNRTSEFAKGTSEWLNRMGVKASPVMVEHIIYGFLGGSARDLINTSEELIGARDDRPARGPEDRMMIRALSTNANPWFTPDYKRFNNVLAQLEQKKQDFKYTKQASDRMTSTQESQLKRLTAIKKDIRGIEGRIAQTMKSSLDRKAKRKEIARLLDSRDEILRRNRTLYQNAANK